MDQQKLRAYSDSEAMRIDFQKKTIDMGRAMFGSYVRMNEILKFRDIPEAWLDGGASDERYARLFGLLESGKLVESLRKTIGLSESWLGSDPDEIKKSISAYWIGNFNATLQQVTALMPVLDKAVDEVQRSLRELKEVERGVSELLRLQGEPYQKDRIDDALQPALEHAASAVHSLYYGAMHMLMLYRGPRAQQTISTDIMRIYGPVP